MRLLEKPAKLLQLHETPKANITCISCYFLRIVNLVNDYFNIVKVVVVNKLEMLHLV